MTRLSPTAVLTWSLAVLLIASIVHLSSVFLLPSVAAQDSFARLSALLPSSGFRVLEAPQPADDSLPFTDPGTLVAVCRYDLASGPWRVRVAIDNAALTSLSFRARNGTVFHTLTDRAALRGRLDVLLGTAAQIDAVEAADSDDTLTRDVRLTAPTNIGLVVIRAMPPVSSGAASLRRRLETAECRIAGQ